MSGRLIWARDGAGWPNRELSQFVKVGHLRFHVQRKGCGRAVLLIHGTGASTHSWRDVLPELAETHDVIAVDLPGHGFTSGARSEDLTLDGMARALKALLEVLGVSPAVLIGHSAGAPVAAAMCLDQVVRADLLVSINGAWRPFPGLMGRLFPVVGRLAHVNATIARMVVWRARSPEAIRRLIEGTGSSIDASGLRLYGRLMRDEQHVRGVLAMMAGWDVAPVYRRLGRLEAACLLIAASDDLAVPAETSIDLAPRLCRAKVEVVRGGGHLLHEVKPALVVKLVRDALWASAR